MTPLRIVLVEDDAMISALLAELLVEFGHEVCAIVVTETDAVEAAARHAPDLMIVDVQLRSGNGLSAMVSILETSAMPHIFMTGGARTTIPSTAVILTKPFGTAGLTAAMERVAWQLAGSVVRRCRPGRSVSTADGCS